MAKLFISATTKGLKSYRTAAAAKLRQLGHDVVVQDEFPMVHEKIAPMLAERIAPCDAVILLIGPVFGARPADWPSELPWRSYTQLEYDIALELQKPVFRFIATEAAELDSVESGADPHQPLQAEYVRSMADYLYWTFSSQDELLTALGKSHLAGFARHNLPQVSLGTLFKGRRDTLQDLHRTLVRRAANKAVITANQTIAGMGGVGKTRLTLEYAWQYCSEYSARLYVKADSPSSLRRNLAELAGTLQVPVVASLDEQLQAVLNWLQTNARWLLILDNVDTEAGKDAVLDFLPQLTKGHVLITSRLATWTGTTEQIALDVLSEPAAVEFLLERTANQRSPAAADAADAAALARQLGYLPLALEQAGAFIARHALSFAAYSRSWEAQEHRVLGWSKDLLGRYDRSVLTTWSVTFEQLDSDGRGLLHLLCWLAPDPIPVSLIEQQRHTGTEEPVDSEAGIANLVAYSFLKRSEDKQSVSMHRLVQEICEYHLPEGVKRGELERSLRMLNDFCTGDVQDVRTWPAMYTPAYPHLLRIVASADRAGITEPTARLMNAVAIYLNQRADFTEAEPLYRRALSIYESSYGWDHPHVAGGLNNLASLLYVTNRHSEAEPLYRRALSISESSYGPDHPQVATRLNNLAELLRVTNRLSEAEPLYRRALSISESSYGPDHPEVANRLNNLAGLLLATNRLSEAEPMFRRALSIFESSYGPDHPEVATCLKNLASLLYVTNRLSEAEPMFRRALSISESSYGPDHPDVAIRLNNLANLLCATNRLSEAEPLYRRALSIYESSYGPDHPQVAVALNNLAELLRETNRVSEAEPLARRALSISESSYGPDHPEVATNLNNLAGLLRATNRLSEAEPLYRRALSIDESSYGPDHPEVATDLNNLAGLLRATNRHSEAEPLYRRALSILVRFQVETGHEHPHVAAARENYEELLGELGLDAAATESRLRSALNPK